MKGWIGAWCVLGLAASLTACGPATTSKPAGPGQGHAKPSTPDPSPQKPVAQPAKLPARPEPSLPRPAGPHGPTFSATAQNKAVDFALLGETDRCGECHQEIAAQWGESAHAFSAFANPFYRVSLDDFVAANGAEKARFCNGCHDVGLQFEDKPQPPSHDDARGFAGVTCTVCHSISEATTDGNASYTLNTSPITLPRDDETLSAHKARVGQAALRTDALCVSCHRGFLTPDTGHEVVISGIDDFGPWRHSGYAGSKATRIDAPVKPQSCTGCHMPRSGPKNLPSHRFAGGHTTLAAAIDAPDQLQALEALLKEAVSVDILPLDTSGVTPVAVDESAVALKPGQRVAFDVVIRNQAVGHNFPGGVKDLRDTWLEVIVTDAAGERLAQSGVEHERTGQEPGAHRLRTVILDSESKAVFEHKVADFRTTVFDRTIKPRDAAVARYAVTLPEGRQLQGPLKVQVRLRHRRLQMALHKRACQDAGTERGKAFRKAAARATGRDVDPCVEQPIVDLVGREVWFGPGAAERNGAMAPRWQRLWEQGLALEHHVQEHLEEARHALETAHRLIPADAPKWAHGAVLGELARVAGRQGRTDDAVKLLEKADRVMPGHPALALIRGEAHAQVWRWEQAAEAYAVASKLAPNDARAWRGLAIALGSLGRREEALLAAEAGLALEPRDPHLLRVQSLSWGRLDPDDARADATREAWLAYRRDDMAPTIKGLCDDPSSDCQRERVAVMMRELEPVRPAQQ